MGTYTGGREKVPAAIARKVAIAKLTGCHEIEIWGDGEQVRSFTFIDDCIDGTRLITASDHSEPLNVGSSEIVTINQLVSMVESIAGVTLRRSYEPDAPQGVRGRNSDNSEIERLLAWSPSTRLIDGLERMFAWVYDQVANHADLTVRSTG
jgi:nucleoside-diphosphate-sugar epimerase